MCSAQDWVCNVIVLAPSRSADGATTSFETLMVSEYDGTVRPQATHTVQVRRF